MQSRRGGKVTSHLGALATGLPGCGERPLRWASVPVRQTQSGLQGTLQSPRKRDSSPVLCRAPCRQLPMNRGTLGGLDSSVCRPLSVSELRVQPAP